MNSYLKKIVAFIMAVEARLVLARYKPKIIAVTGSVGKTSAKDAIYAVLMREVHVRRSLKSYNSEFGVPLTILGCENAWGNPWGWIKNIAKGVYLIVVKQSYPEWLIVEVGADAPGDIKAIARWLKPDIAVITSIPDVPVHVEFFSSPEEVAREKRELAVYVKQGGKLFINGDEARTREIAKEFRGIAQTFGFSSECDFQATHDTFFYEENKLAGMQFRVNANGSSVPIVTLGAPGKPRIYAALAACAVATELKVDLVSVAASLREGEVTPGRMRVIEGKNGSLIFDDTYNASPHATRSALETLINVPRAKRRIAVLADMLELGKFSTEEHKKIGKYAAECADMLITVGFRAKLIASAAKEAGLSEKKIVQYEQGESARAGKELAEILKEGDVILVKGSQSMRMERTVKAIMAEPARAKELLVRQDEEWLRKK